MRYNAALDTMVAYRAAPSLNLIREHYGLDRLVRLGSNECPDGPFPEVIEALRSALTEIHRYPDGGCRDLRAALAERFGLPEGRVAVGNGSCELLMLLGQALVTPGEHLVYPHPSFVMYGTIATARQADAQPVDLKDHANDLEAMAAAARPDTRMIIVCNPNNPTGGYVPAKALRRFLDAVSPETAVVVDEAYIEYVTSDGHEDSVPWLDLYPNLILVRTFSKIYGLAGLRVGYAMGRPDLIEALDKIRQPYNVNYLSQLAAVESLRHSHRLEARRNHVAVERLRIGEKLSSLDIPYLPTETNFLLVGVKALERAGEEVAQALLERGVVTRAGDAMSCPGWLRVTIGSKEENDFFLQALEEIAGGG